MTYNTYCRHIVVGRAQYYCTGDTAVARPKRARNESRFNYFSSFFFFFRQLSTTFSPKIPPSVYRAGATGSAYEACKIEKKN